MAVMGSIDEVDTGGKFDGPKIYLIFGMVSMLIATVFRWVFIGMVPDGILTQIL